MATTFSSARAQAALDTPTGYSRWIRCTVSRDGVSVNLEPTAASFTQDARRNGRWDGRLTFTGQDMMPARASDLLTPFGTRVAVELGIELLDGSVSTVPYGVYEITSSRADTDAGNRVVEIGLSDISGSIDRYRFETPLTVVSGTDLGTMVNTVLTNRTGFNPGVSTVGSTLGADRIFGLETGTGPWAEILDVLSGFSRTAWFNRVGRVNVGTLVPDPTTSYPLGALTGLSVNFDTLPPNVIVARGESQDDIPPVQAVSIDDDPTSPTYAGVGPGTSPYGRVTQFFSSPLILTVAQAQAAADTILAQNVGAGATYTITRPYDPTITAGDTVAWNGSTYAVDAVTIDFAGETSVQVRELGS